MAFDSILISSESKNGFKLTVKYLDSALARSPILNEIFWKVNKSK